MPKREELNKTPAEWASLAREVAALLPSVGEGWTVERGDLSSRPVIANGAGLRLSIGQSHIYAERDRIAIDHAYTYKQLPDNPPNIRITVGSKRSAKGIAREIENRFLTPLSELARRVEAEGRRQEQRAASFAEAVRELREAGGDLFTVKVGDENEATISKTNGGAEYYIRDGRATAKSVRLHLDSLDVEEAATILRALRALRDARRGANDDETAQAWRDELAA